MAELSVGSDDSKLSVVSSGSTINMSGTNPLPNIYNISNNRDGGPVLKRLGPDDVMTHSGPPDRDRDFYELVDDENEKIHHDLSGRARKSHRNTLEDWEHAQLASFTRQELHHNYQKSNLDRILGNLKSVIYLNLQDNELLTLSTHSFPRCEYINLDENFLTSLKQLPTLPRIKHLTIQNNGISSLDGLDSLHSSPIQELFMMGNPVAFKIGYRYKVFQILPSLRLLDGVIKQEEDLNPPDNVQNDLGGGRCTVS